MGRTYRTHHPKFAPGRTVNLRSFRRSLPFQRDDKGNITGYDQLLNDSRKNVEHYDSSGALYANATEALQGDRFYVEQGDNGFRFKETETGKYLALKGHWIGLDDEGTDLWFEEWPKEEGRYIITPRGDNIYPDDGPGYHLWFEGAPDAVFRNGDDDLNVKGEGQHAIFWIDTLVGL
ncbi:hypothetical protein AnigIFM63309_004245 [Aspergillus niger]|uniref:Uncharacterized protein n=1 Tax=Aspergillus welwitschiae TaxID=1341132 RepID=A0A3F3PUF2_9EURO|nr:hypothetical protein BDQ94DRAFT_173426 [Aspergillus welwitschiae]RDH29936.1 hypothetical protein BDQ94DRAFT_173426 [Aspergillus welwitschiae]GKZ63127.1 hypothetical protein AnigIFM49718_010858 [Aspergillus niger]GLA19092.1 hypothetical protein AnigIFM62618_006755 [Aspergillus niger]GLA37333.1 hypothetical protein AnigIFM63309_004245 [Aspergillus niger]